MKERGVLFQGSMVRALVADLKTMTRRAAKLNSAGRVFKGGKNWHPGDPDAVLACPYGQVGDRISVRETFFAFGRWETRFNAKKGRDEWHFVDMTLECDRAYQYAADNPDVPLAKGRGVLPGWYKRPAIFMPRVASRITLEITSIRVERLQDISEADAIEEGCEPNYLPNRAYEDEPQKSGYVSLWQGINGHGSWKANPYVWVISFRRVKP